MNTDGFILVSKRRRAKARAAIPKTDEETSTPESVEASILGILKAKEELLDGQSYKEFEVNVKNASSCLESEGEVKISTIICYGLGRPSQSRIARYQTALLLILRDYFDTKVDIYDPVFTDEDILILRRFSFAILEQNEEGKKQVTEPTLFYMPHCGKGLYNNLLWANWHYECLGKCIIIGNSFCQIVENIPERVMQKYYRYILQASQYFSEYPIKNIIQEDNIFNDMSVHVMKNNLATLPDDFWTTESEPQYDCDAEFVQVKR